MTVLKVASARLITSPLRVPSATLSQVVLGAEPATGDAIAAEVLEGATFSNATENGITGTMPDRGAVNIIPTAEDQAIPEGYHSGSGVVSGAPIANAKAAVDAANEETSADLDAGIALVASNYSDIKAEIAAKGVDMTGVIPSGYDAAIASIPAASGDAVAADLLVGKTASTDAGAITGTRPPSVVMFSGVSGDAGEAWPSPRFTDNGDGTVTDNATGLVWPKDISAGNSKNWTDAQTYCSSFSGGGYSDWRSPTTKELLSLFAYNTANPALPPGHPFTTTSVNYIWTKNQRLTTPANGFYVFAGDGTLAQTAKTNNWPHTALPVRGPIAL